MGDSCQEDLCSQTKVEPGQDKDEEESRRREKDTCREEGKDNKSQACAEEECGGQEARSKTSSEEVGKAKPVQGWQAKHVPEVRLGQQHDGPGTLDAAAHGHGRISIHEERRDEDEGGEHDDEEDAHEDEHHEGDGAQPRVRWKCMGRQQYDEEVLECSVYLESSFQFTITWMFPILNLLCCNWKILTFSQNFISVLCKCTFVIQNYPTFNKF